MKIGTVALVVSPGDELERRLLDAISDDREIYVLESAVHSGRTNPLETVYEMRREQLEQDEAFADYVEDLLTQPFVKPEIQEHGVQWFRSRLSIDHYRQREEEAAKLIADYAFNIFKEDPKKHEFILDGPSSRVRIRVFEVEKERQEAV